MATLGTKLLKLREEHRLSQTEFAETIGVSQNAYSRWEADKCKPHVEHLFKIAQYYQIDMKILLDNNRTIIFSQNGITGINKIITNNVPAINDTVLSELMDRILKTQEYVLSLLNLELKMITELLKNY